MAANVSAINAAITLIVDMINDEQSALGKGEVASFSAYGNLLPDFLALLPQIGDIPSEAKALGEADYVALVDGVASKLKLSNAKAEAIVSDACKAFHDNFGSMLGDLEQLASDIKGHVAAKKG